MTLYIHEWKQNYKGLLIWAISVASIILVCMMLYPQMKNEAGAVGEMFAQMGGFSAAFGMDQVDMGDALGFFSVDCGNILLLGSAMFSALLGIGMLSKEEDAHTAEFLLTHPISRYNVILQKLVAVHTMIVLFVLINFVMTIIAFLCIGETICWKELAMIFFADLLLALEIASVCYAFSASLKTVSVGIGIGSTILLYFFNLYGNIDRNAKWTQYVTPFAYADTSKIVVEGALDIKLLYVGMFVLLCGTVIAFFCYAKKDIA